MKKQEKSIKLQSISLNRGWQKEASLTGSATFGDRDKNGEGIEIKLVLGAAQIAKIVEACGDALKDEAKKKAQAFYETAAIEVSRLLEAPKKDKE